MTEVHLIEENKRAKFEEAAQLRTANVLDKLRVLRGLSNRNSYDYTDAHVSLIFDKIRAEVDAAEAEMRGIEKPVLDFSKLISEIPE